MNNENATIKIFDTTLRDGEQSPGASMTIEEKVKLAHQLKRLGVDIIEAGFPVISEGDYEAVSRIAAEVQGPVICALARCTAQDVIAAANALQPAMNKRIHVFIASSEVHMRHKLQMTPAKVKENAVKAIRQAREYCDDVEFSAEDATRSDAGFLVELFSAAIAAGANTINVPDTVGYVTPGEYAALIERLKAEVKGIDTVTLSVHCHNDLGLATANSLEAINHGATQIECTVNGIGERSGNAALEEVVMAIKTREDLIGHRTNINTRELVNSSRMVSKITGIQVQPNKAVVGASAFAHEAGIHQHGMLANRETYEIMRPEDVGFNRSQLVIGKHSGRHAIKQWLTEHAIELDDDSVVVLSREVKAFSDTAKSISDADIFRLMQESSSRACQAAVESY